MNNLLTNLNLSDNQERNKTRELILKTINKLAPELTNIQPRQKQRRRVMHFIPAHRTDFIDKLEEIEADTIIFDLEDSVPQAKKEEARNNLLKINHNKFLNKEFCIRINYQEQELYKADIEAVKTIDFDLLMLPKLNNSNDVKKILSDLGKNIDVFACIETIESFKNAEEIIKLPELTCFVFGAEDFYSELSVRHRIRKGDIIDNQEDRDKYLRFVQPLIMFATQYDKQYIDGVHTYLKDKSENTEAAQEHLHKECQLMKNEGALGKISIHPSQIEIIKQEFDVILEEIRQAINKLEIFNENTAVIVEEGAMQDTPETAAAKRILIDALRYL